MLVKVEITPFFPLDAAVRDRHQAWITTDRKTVHMPPCATESEALAQALRYCTLEQERGEWSSLFGTRS